MRLLCLAARFARWPRWRRLGLFCLLLLLLPGRAAAHSPFEGTARVVLLENQIEVTLLAGSGLTEQLLRGSGVSALPNVGPGVALPLTQAAELFTLQSQGTNLSIREFRVMSDGLESLFILSYPRPASDNLTIVGNYTRHLPAATISPIVVLDDERRILASHLAQVGSSTLTLTLPPDRLLATTDNTSLVSAITSNATAPAPAIGSATVQPAFGAYLRLGIHHIVTGYDHLLFLFALLVGCKRIGPMLAIITCFTLAHSITLALAAMNVVAISPRLVEPIIAASIIFVGLENFRRSDNVKARCWLALGFGLIHGFGFAGALRETGLGDSAGALVSALFSFNLGVELGQLAIAAIFLGALWQLRRFKPVEQYATPVISAVVIALGGWWLVERTLLS